MSPHAVIFLTLMCSLRKLKRKGFSLLYSAAPTLGSLSTKRSLLDRSGVCLMPSDNKQLGDKISLYPQADTQTHWSSSSREVMQHTLRFFFTWIKSWDLESSQNRKRRQWGVFICLLLTEKSLKKQNEKESCSDFGRDHERRHKQRSFLGLFSGGTKLKKAKRSWAMYRLPFLSVSLHS